MPKIEQQNRDSVDAEPGDLRRTFMEKHWIHRIYYAFFNITLWDAEEIGRSEELDGITPEWIDYRLTCKHPGCKVEKRERRYPPMSII